MASIPLVFTRPAQPVVGGPVPLVFGQGGATRGPKQWWQTSEGSSGYVGWPGLHTPATRVCQAWPFPKTLQVPFHPSLRGG